MRRVIALAVVGGLAALAGLAVWRLAGTRAPAAISWAGTPASTAASASAPASATVPAAAAAAATDPGAATVATAGLRGRVIFGNELHEGEAPAVCVVVFGPGGEVARGGVGESGYAFPALPAGVPLVVVAWQPGWASVGTLELTAQAGAPGWTTAFDAAAARSGCTLVPGEVRSLDLVLTGAETAVFVARLARPIRPRPETYVWEAHHRVPGDPDAGHSLGYTGEQPADGFLDGEPRRVEANCACGPAVEFTVHIPGHRPWRRVVEIPDRPGTIEFVVDPVPRGLGTHGRVVDAATGQPIAGALIGPWPRPDGEDEGGGGIPGLGDAPALRAPWVSAWDGWLAGRPADADGRFVLDEALFEEPVFAVVPGVGCSCWQSLEDATGEVVLAVVAGNAVEGTVRDPQTGQPVQDGEVVLVRHLANPPEALTFEDSTSAPDPAFRTRAGSGVACRTDAAGRFAFAGIPVGWIVEPVVRESDGLVALPRPALPPNAEEQAAYARERHWPESTLAAWLERRVAAGELVRFAAPGGRARVDLRAVVRPGRWLECEVPRVPAEDDEPQTADVTHTCEVERLAGAGEVAGQAERELEDGRSEFVATTVADGRTREVRTLRYSSTIDGNPARLRIFLQIGRNTVRLACEGWVAETPAYDVTGPGAPEHVRLEWRRDEG